MRAKVIMLVLALSLSYVELRSQSAETPLPADSAVTQDPSVDGAFSESGDSVPSRNNPDDPLPPLPPDPEDPLGDSMAEAIYVGSKSSDFFFSDIRDTRYNTNQYTGRSTKDVFYRFVLTVPMSVTITHDGSTLRNTYMSLLNSSGSLIESNDDYSGEGHCSDTLQAFISSQLAAGTYYVVSEGYSSDGIIKTNITGNVEAGYGYPSIPSTYSTDPGTAVGGMGGSFGVSPMGAATYSIPIDVPSGINGFQPSLGIVYNSQSGNGMAGYGTNLSGISCITRAPKDIYHDTNASGLTFLSTDALYLDGVRLVLVYGTSGVPGAIYHPESSPFTTVTVMGSYTDSNNNTWFEVQTPDGMKYRYGYDSASRLSYTDSSNRQKIHSWYLCRAEQPTGNYITYSYTINNKCIYPDQISYGGNLSQSTSHYNVIEFTYENRSDAVPVRFDGQKGSMGQRLKTITSKTNGTTFRTYTLNYNTTGDGTARKYSRLVGVTESNAQNEALPATYLGWSFLPVTNVNASTLLVNAPSNINQLVSFPFDNQTFIASDMNNDGLADIVGIAPVSVPTGPNSNVEETYVYVYEASRNSTGGIEYVSGELYETPGSFVYQPILYGHSSSLGLSNTLSIDIDGDGVNELLLPYFYTQSGNGSSLTFLLAGENYPIPTGTQYNLTGTSVPLYSTGDINNDGRCDVVYCERNPSGVYYPFTILSYNPDYDPDSSSSNPFISNSFSLYLSDEPKALYLSDLNGNGMTDLLVIQDDCYSIYWNNGSGNFSTIYSGFNDISVINFLVDTRFLTPGDFNGDGLLDFLSNEMDSNIWYLYINNGNGIFSRLAALTDSEISDQSFTTHDNDEVCGHTIDFDGDGLEDMIVTKAVYFEDSNWLGQTWGAFDYTVTKWLRSSGNALSIVYSSTSTDSEDKYPGKYIVSDFDGDGHVELVNYGYDCANGTNANDNPIWRIYKNSSLSVQSGRVTSVTGDFGATTTITYSTLSNPMVYSKGGTDAYPAPRYTIPLNVVRQTVENNGATGSQTTLYSYNGLKMHLKGRGLLGFNKVTANNTTMGVTTENGITQWDGVRYIPKVTYSKTYLDSQTAQTTTTLTITVKEDSTYFAYPSQTVETDLDGNTVTTARTYNTTEGYITQETSTYATGMYRTVYYQDYEEKGGAYRPQTVIASQCHPDDGQPFSRTTKYTYNNTTGLVTRRKDNHGTSLELTTDYTYDAWGNILSEQVSATGITTLTTYHKYDSTHRFTLRTYTSPASSVLRRTYDTWGHVLTEQDSVNTSIENTVTHTYDGWGNLTLTQIPGGGEISYTRGWSHDPAQRWFVLEQGNHRPWVKTWYDNRGREVKTESVGPNNVSLTNTISYNSKGLVSGRTTTEGSLSLTTTYAYDQRGRVVSETASGNVTTTYVYTGHEVNNTVSHGVSVTHNGRTVTTKYDGWGGVVSVTDPSSQDITYTYKSNGQPASTAVGSVTYTFGYDAAGNRTSFSDPDAGTTTYTYDALGREISRIDGRGVAFSTSYDYLGRVTARTAGNEQITYSYGTSGTGAMRLTQLSNGSMAKSYTYDTYGRTSTVTHMGNATTYSYTTDGLVSTISRPGSKTDTYTYDSYGNVTGLNAVSGGMTWSRTGYTGASSTSSLALQNGSYPFVRTASLDSNGQPNAMSLTRNNSTLRSESYTFSPVTGNLTSRTVGSTTETFTYDVLDRLKKVQVGNQTTLDMTYGANGNITSKTGIGSYEYGTSSKPHAVTAVDNTSGIIPEHTQSVTYNAWGKVSEISYVSGGDTYQYAITYGPDLERWFTYFKKNGVTQYYTYYGVGYENCYHQEPGATAYTLRTYYVNTPDGLSGIVRYDSRTSTYTPYAVETDHLGSITALYNSSGTKVMGASFDAWGKRTQTTSTLEFRRGYTGHEHIDGFDLINMNGRVYDPLIGRFLSPDPFIQMPDFSQSFNRYSYCLNNPYKYTDPDGEFVVALVGGILFATGMTNVIIQASNGSINSVGDVLSAFAGGVAAGVSEATSLAFGFAELSTGSPLGVLLGHSIIFGKSANFTTTSVNSILHPFNAAQIFMGRYYTDENKGAWDQFKQGLSRFTWEGPQTWAGYNWSQIRSIGDRVDRVDYLGGATFCINEDGNYGSVSLGNYINADIDGSYSGSITDYPTLMHEYGHTFDSRKMGPMYLFTIGIPSAKSAKDSEEINNQYTHSWYWTELRANRAAKEYFGRYYGIDWSQYENFVESYYYYPTVKPLPQLLQENYLEWYYLNR